MSKAQRYFTFLGVLVVVVAVVSRATGWPLGIIALGLFIGWPLLGTLITLDDDMPGGWSNPGGKATPEWKTLAWHVEILLCRGSIVVAAFAIQARADPRLALTLVVAAIVMAAIGFPRTLAFLRARPAGAGDTTATGS
jgi:hypothetical protein